MKPPPPQPPSLPPLQEVRAQLAEAWRGRELVRRLQARANALAEAERGAERLGRLLVAPVLADARERLAATSMGEVPGVAVSAATGAGVPGVAAALERLPEPLDLVIVRENTEGFYADRNTHACPRRNARKLKKWTEMEQNLLKWLERKSIIGYNKLA